MLLCFRVGTAAEEERKGHRWVNCIDRMRDAGRRDIVD